LPKPFPLGNNYGRMGAPVTDALRRAALAGDQKKLRMACERALSAAANGSLPHLAWIADRIDGKSVARVEHVGGDRREIDLSEIVRMVLASRTQEAQDVECVSLPGADENHSRSDPAVQQDPPIPQIGEAGGVVEAGAPSTIGPKNEEPE